MNDKQNIAGSDAMKKAASIVVVGEFWDGNKFCRYSYDIRYPKKKGNVDYWLTYWHNIIHTGTWAGRVKSYAIWQLNEGEKIGDAIVRWASQ